MSIHLLVVMATDFEGTFWSRIPIYMYFMMMTKNEIGRNAAVWSDWPNQIYDVISDDDILFCSEFVVRETSQIRW